MSNIHHILWACRSLTSFWHQTFQMISQITGILTPPDPALNLGIDKLPTQHRTVVLHVLLAAKSLITKMWQRSLSPNISELTAMINLHYTYEKHFLLGPIPYLDLNRHGSNRFMMHLLVTIDLPHWMLSFAY